MRRAMVVASSLALASCSPGSIEQVGDAGPVVEPEAGTAADGAVLARSQAIFTGKLVASAASPATCRAAGRSFAVGTFDPPAPIAGGAMSSGGTATVFCEVKPIGGGFLLSASVALDGGVMPGSVTLDATLDGTGASKAGKIGLNLQGAAFSSDTCVLDPNVRPGQSAPAAGRDWIGIRCANAEWKSDMQTCDIVGELRVENCGQ